MDDCSCPRYHLQHPFPVNVLLFFTFTASYKRSIEILFTGDKLIESIVSRVHLRQKDIPLRMYVDQTVHKTHEPQTNAFFSTDLRRRAENYREQTLCHSVRINKSLQIQPR